MHHQSLQMKWFCPSLVILDDTICNTSSYSIKTHIPRPFSGPFEKCEAASLYADSRMVLSPAGDTATTDRIWNNFESETPTAILVEQLHDILRALPFPAIPWRRMFVPLEINSTHFAARAGAILVTSLAELKRAPVAAMQRLVRHAVGSTLMDAEVSRVLEHHNSRPENSLVNSRRFDRALPGAVQPQNRTLALLTRFYRASKLALEVE